MPLLSWVGFEQQTNSTLSDPDGRALVDQLARSILAWSARDCHRLGWAYGTYTESFNNDAATHTSVRAGDYSETYNLTGKDIPGDTMEVQDSYKLPVIA